MASYRRGFKNKVWDQFWHWHPKCGAYPTTNCIMRKDRPAEDELCAKCRELSGEGG